MPFRSKAQQRAAFSGALGAEMRTKAKEWAHETPNLKDLPQHVSDKAAGKALAGLRGAHKGKGKG